MKTLRSLSIALLALLVLVSSTSFVVSVHYCMGEVKDVAFFSKAESCQQASMCHAAPRCCGDESFIHDSNDFKPATSKISVPDVAFIFIQQPSVLLAEVVPHRLVTVNHFGLYDPPDPATDLTIEHHSLII